ncbi:hypothetical protein ABK040_011016 [Willaertia magna]
MSKNLFLYGSINNPTILSTGVITHNNQNIPADKLNENDMIESVFSTNLNLEETPNYNNLIDYISDIPFDHLEQQIQQQNDMNNTDINTNIIIPILRGENSSLIKVIWGKDPNPNILIEIEPIDFQRDESAREAFSLSEGYFVPPIIQNILLVNKQLPPSPVNNTTMLNHNNQQQQQQQMVKEEMNSPMGMMNNRVATPQQQFVQTPQQHQVRVKQEYETPQQQQVYTTPMQQQVQTPQPMVQPTISTTNMKRIDSGISSTGYVGTPSSQTTYTPMSSTTENQSDFPMTEGGTVDEEGKKKKKKKKDKKSSKEGGSSEKKKKRKKKEGEEGSTGTSGEKKEKKKKKKKDKEGSSSTSGEKKEKKKRKKEEGTSDPNGMAPTQPQI